jgi:PBP superfamily domain
MRNLKIAAAVALTIGGFSVAQANPTAAQCAAPNNVLYVAGSSAAQNAFANALAIDLFGGVANENVYSGTNGNFRAYCGTAVANTAGITAGNTVTVYYRGEGGSVVGALPIITNKPVKFLDISTAACQVAAPVVNGTSASVGTTDGWSGCVSNHAVEMGVTDLEPGVFVGTNYPTDYSTTVFGKATPAQLKALASVPLFQQVFGLFVNTTGINGGGANQALNLTKETVSNIMAGNYADWNSVPTFNPTTGAVGVVSNVSVPITFVHREEGSGTRTGASIYFMGTLCTTLPVPINDPGPDGYATGDVLTTVNATNGSITYASIDNVGAKPNVSLVSLSGVTPSNAAATSGQYDWWFEATAQKGTINSTGTSLYNWLVGGELQNLATAPHTAQILAIPNVGSNVGAVPATANTISGKTIYINPFSKSGNSCNVPGETN